MVCFASSRSFKTGRADDRNKPLTELVDRRLEVLVSLINAKRRGVFTAPKEVVATDRFSLMSARLDAAIAATAGASVALNPEDAVLVPGYDSRLAAVVTNGGVAEIQIKQLKWRARPQQRYSSGGEDVARH